jgi:CRP-like cAMP-binding protein
MSPQWWRLHDGDWLMGTTVGDARQILARTELFGSFSEHDLDVLLSCARERVMRRDEILFQRGDPGVSMMVILAGEVRIILPGEQRDDQVLNRLLAGSVFGEIALFDGKPRSADAVAATNGRLLVIERAVMLQVLERDGEFARRVIEIICLRLRATLSQLDALLFQDVQSRIIGHLAQMIEQRGIERIDITQTELARVVGAARETVNRKLQEIQAAGLITLAPGRILILDPARLRALVLGRFALR